MQNHLHRASTLAAGLLVLLCSITLISGVSQQTYELVQVPTPYAQGLLRDAGWLRVLIALDDLFIAAYLSTTLLLVGRLADGRWTALHVFVVMAGIAGAVLDLQENHHLLTLLRWAQLGQAVPAEEILRRSDLSQLKWMLGHAAFVAVGLLLPASRGTTRRLFRASMIFVQLPIGALTWAVDDAAWGVGLTWARYGAFVLGFAFIAWIARAGLSGAGTDEPA